MLFLGKQLGMFTKEGARNPTGFSYGSFVKESGTIKS